MQAVRQLESELRELASRIAADEGLELVELALRGSGGRRVLRVDIDRAGARGVDVSDCQRVSQALGNALDQSGLLDSAYVLEVSSPGIDRPIRTADDFRRCVGRRIRVTATGPDEGQHLYSGMLLGSEDEVLLLELDDKEQVRLPLASVVSAKQEVGI